MFVCVCVCVCVCVGGCECTYPYPSCAVSHMHLPSTLYTSSSKDGGWLRVDQSLPSALARGIGSRIVARDGSKCCMYICMSLKLLECN